MANETRKPRSSARGEIPSRVISDRENIIPTARASWEISLEYAGKPPVANPTTRPEATIVGKLRQGRNMRRRDGPALKSLAHRGSERGEDGPEHRESDSELLGEGHPLVHPEPSHEDRDHRVRCRERHDDGERTEPDREEDRDPCDPEQQE